MKEEKKLWNKIQALRDHRDYLSMELAAMPKNCIQEQDFKNRISEVNNQIEQLENEVKINYSNEY